MVDYCGKGCLFFYNLIYLGISGAVIYLSVLFVTNWGDYSSLVSNTYTIVPAGIIFVYGILLSITGLVGLCGNCKENRCILGVFFTLLFLTFAINIVVESLVYLKDHQIQNSLHDNLLDSFYKYYDSQSTAKRGFDKMQQSFECCGVYGPSDWKNISESIPSSCCRFSDQQCYELPGNLYEKKQSFEMIPERNLIKEQYVDIVENVALNLFKVNNKDSTTNSNEGCWSKLLPAFKRNLKIFTSVLMAFIVFQLCGLILTVYMLVLLRTKGYIRVLETPPNA